MVDLQIDLSKCDKCMECINICTSGALTYTTIFSFVPDECTYCEACIDVCIPEAITIKG